jgi:hypothetical protein
MNIKYSKKDQIWKHCPFLKRCKHRVTQHYFRNICDKEAYLRCIHYTKRVEEFKTPLEWLKKLAIEEAKRHRGKARTKINAR